MERNLPAMQQTPLPFLGQEDLKKGMATHPTFLPGESHGQRSLVGYSSWGCKGSDMTEQLTLSLFYTCQFHTSTNLNQPCIDCVLRLQSADG